MCTGSCTSSRIAPPRSLTARTVNVFQWLSIPLANNTSWPINIATSPSKIVSATTKKFTSYPMFLFPERKSIGTTEEPRTGIAVVSPMATAANLGSTSGVLHQSCTDWRIRDSSAPVSTMDKNFLPRISTVTTGWLSPGLDSTRSDAIRADMAPLSYQFPSNGFVSSSCRSEAILPVKCFAIWRPPLLQLLPRLLPFLFPYAPLFPPDPRLKFELELELLFEFEPEPDPELEPPEPVPPEPPPLSPLPGPGPPVPPLSLSRPLLLSGHSNVLCVSFLQILQNLLQKAAGCPTILQSVHSVFLNGHSPGLWFRSLHRQHLLRLLLPPPCLPSNRARTLGSVDCLSAATTASESAADTAASLEGILPRACSRRMALPSINCALAIIESSVRCTSWPIVLYSSDTATVNWFTSVDCSCGLPTSAHLATALRNRATKSASASPGFIRKPKKVCTAPPAEGKY